MFFFFRVLLFVPLSTFCRGVRFRKEEQLLRAEEEARRRMERADARRKEHRRGIVRKANDANSKVGRLHCNMYVHVARMFSPSAFLISSAI